MPITKLKDISEIIMGQSPKGSSYNQEGKGLPLLNGAADYKGQNFDPNQFTDCPTRTVQKGDIILGIRATIGNFAFADKAYCIGRGVAGIRVNENIANKQYIKRSIEKGLNDILHTASGSTIKGIKKEDLTEMEFDLPPVDIQERIAEILDAADALRQKDRQLLEKYEQLSQSIFLDMFGDPLVKGFKYEIDKFGNHIEILTDYHANGSYEILKKHVELLNDKDYALMVRTTDLEANDFENNVKYIKKSAYEFLEKSKVFGGELIINKIGSAGKVYLMPFLSKPVSLGMNAFMIRPKSTINNLFLYHQLISDFGERQIQRRVKGAVTKTIRKDAIRDINIFVPDIEIQKEFVKRLELVKNQLDLVKKASKKSESLFQSLLQKAFKGELVPEDQLKPA